MNQHQRWTEPEDDDVPEFTIEAAYKTHNREGLPVRPGWRYVLKWLENGERKQFRQYGYPTKAAALAEAKAKADALARTLLPVHVETYRPEF